MKQAYCYIIYNILKYILDVLYVIIHWNNTRKEHKISQNNQKVYMLLIIVDVLIFAQTESSFDI